MVMYGYESWTVKKAEHRSIDAFELWCWKKLLRVPWTARRSNQPVLRKSALNIHGEYRCWSSNTLATWCKEMTHWKRPWCWERLRAWGQGGDREWNGWMASLTQWTWIGANWEVVKDREAWRAAVCGAAKCGTWLSYWTKTTTFL